MNSNENPIPISRGKEIDAQRLIETLRQKRSMLEKWHLDIGKKIRDKQVLFNREFMKPGDRRDYALIADLSAEIKDLDEAGNKIFDLMQELDNLLQEGKERLREIEDLTAEMEKIIALEDKLKGQTKKK